MPLALLHAIIVADDPIDCIRMRMLPGLSTLWPSVTRTGVHAVTLVRLVSPRLVVVGVPDDADNALWTIAALKRSGYSGCVVAIARLRTHVRDQALHNAGAAAVFDNPPPPGRLLGFLKENGVADRHGSAPRSPTPSVITIGASLVDLEQGKIHREGAMVRLSSLQAKLLVALLRRRGQAVTRRELAVELWGTDVPAHASIDRHVSKLRQLLGDPGGAPRNLLTVPRVGYRLAGAEW